MQYRKLLPEKVFDGFRMHQDLVIVSQPDGTIEALLPVAEAGDDVEQVNGLLTPGLINCHCHLELSHLKGKIPEGTGLVDFVVNVVAIRAAPPQEIAEAITSAEAAMIKTGVVAVGDICNNNFTLAQKQKANLAYYNFIEASGWLPAVSAERIERAKVLLDAFNRLPTAVSSIVPHAPYSVSGALWEGLRPHFQNNVVSIHNQETAFEDEFFLQGTGDFQRMYELMGIDNSHHLPSKKSSLPSYFHRLTVAKNIILVHNTFTKQEDIDYVKKMSGEWSVGTDLFQATQPLMAKAKPKTFFCLCPNANLYIESVLPPVELFLKNNCPLVLGTDSLASNWSLSIADEMKTLRHHFPQIQLEQLLTWATRNGAEALGMQGRLGSFEKGKKPGMVLFDENSLNVLKIF